MEKPYDFKNLLERLKAEGIEVAEETAKAFIKTLFPWLTESALMSENKFDDVFAALYPLAEQQILGLAENINKADNPA